MKKNAVIVLIAILLLITAFWIYNKNRESSLINLPTGSTISSIHLINKSETRIIDNSYEIEKLVTRLSNSKLTGKESVQDVPLTDDYGTILLNLKDGEAIKLYVYQENGKWFIELPYQGIYIINANTK